MRGNGPPPAPLRESLSRQPDKIEQCRTPRSRLRSTLPKTSSWPGFTENDRYKAEFLDGAGYEIANTSANHSQISANLVGELIAGLRKKGCRVLAQGIFVKIPKRPGLLQPDATVVREELAYFNGRRDVITNPRIIFEILSPSTSGRDFETKCEAYQQIESLQAYILIYQDSPKAAIFTRAANESWLLKRYTGLDATFPIGNTGLDAALRGLYRDVVFPTFHRAKAKTRAR